MPAPPGPKLRAVEWEVMPMPSHSEAVRLVERWHYSGSAANTSVARHGLYRAGQPWGDPFGVALWMPPTRLAALTITDDWEGVLNLTRLVVAPDMPTNSASYLLGRSMKLIDRDRWPVLLTYADPNQGHTGIVYKATNWTFLGEVPAGDVWVGPDGKQRGRKRGPKCITRQEMRDMGYVRQPQVPKLKFVHIMERKKRVA
jgi:hypothetical protein